jgi:hypothetical protein
MTQLGAGKLGSQLVGVLSTCSVQDIASLYLSAGYDVHLHNHTAILKAQRHSAAGTNVPNRW